MSAPALLAAAPQVVREEVIRFADVTVHYGTTPALIDFSLTVAAGETVALLGPSGSGKSTALKALAGFERPRSGRLFLAGRDVTDLPPYRRGIGVVVQQYALFPHMRVAENVAFGLRARRVRKAAASARVDQVLELVGMGRYRDRYPRELSGGQQQRVAIARALAVEPRVLLLDEPLSALDAQLRQDMLAELQRLRRDLPDIAMLYVTHDQVEALSLAERIVVMRDGRIVDSGPARTLYDAPPSEFTASFLGDANLLPATVVAPDAVRVGPLTVPCHDLGLAVGTQALLCARPHELRLDGAGLPGLLAAVQWRGAAYRLSVELEHGPTVRLDVSSADGLPLIGEKVQVVLASGAGVLVPQRVP
ncbi:MAG: ABC transporter ATP-binding protein [Mycobacteriaceae bacterium]